jgi:hypothetical protein
MWWSFASLARWIPHNRVQFSSQVTNKSFRVTTKLQSPPSRLGDADHQEYQAIDFHLTKRSLMRVVCALGGSHAH